MKREKFIFTFLTIGLFLLSACKQIEHEVNTYYRVDISVTEITQKSEGYLFGGSAILSTDDNEEVTSNWEIIKLIVGETKLSVKEANIEDWLFAYEMEVIITNNSTNKSITHNIDGINSLSVGNSFVIPDTNENITFFTDLIKKRQSATVEIKGFSSESGINLIFRLKIAALVGLG